MATMKCTECPNSCCAAHKDNKMRDFEGRTYCLEHEDLLETLSESQSQVSTGSEENTTETPTSATAASSVSEQSASKTKGSSKNGNNGDKVKEKDSAAAADKEKKVKETLPPKKRGQKPQADGDKPSNGTGKQGRGRRGSTKEAGQRGSSLDDTLAVPPMFDDDDEEFDLVIDIPNF